jgi:YVTN family beta-propeller protein
MSICLSRLYAKTSCVLYMADYPKGFDRLKVTPRCLRGPGYLRSRLLLFACVTLLSVGWPIGGYAQSLMTTVAAGTNPGPVAVNPVTNRTYVASFQDGTVKVIDGATNEVVATVTVGSPGAIAVNPVTNMIYVADTSTNTVTVIDGATNVAGSPIMVGTTPITLAVNPATNMIYVGNQTSNNVSVISGSTNAVILTLAAGTNPQVIGVNPVTNKIYVVNNASNNVTVIDGSTSPQSILATIGVGTNALSIGVNPVTNLIYVANSGSGTVTVINGAVNTTASNLTVTVGSQPRVLTVNPVSNEIYVANHSTGTVTVINGALNTTASNVTVTVGSAPVSVAVNPTTNQIYVANHTSGSGGGTLSVIDGTLNTTASTATVPFAVGAFPVALAVNPVTNQVYAADQSSNDVTIFSGATDLTAVVTVGSSSQANGTSIAANPATNKIYVPNSFSNTVTVIDGTTNVTTTITTGIGTDVDAVAVNPVTDKIYVTNLADSTVSVIDGSTDTVSDVVTVGSSSQANRTSIAVNPVTNKIYVPNSFSNTVTVINGATNATTTITTGIGTDVDAVAVNPVTNKIYVTNLADDTVSVIDGSTDTVSAVVTVGSSSQANGTSIAVNPVTNKIYVPNSFSNTVTVIDGATNATTTITTDIGTDVDKVAVNPVTNKIYVTNLADGTVSVIDGSTETVSAVVTVGSSSQANRTSIAVNPVTNKIYVPNSFSNTVTVIDGASNTTTTLTAGIGTDVDAVAVNLATNNIYVTNLADSTVTAISEEQVQTVPLTTTIAPLAGNVSTTSTPTFTFTAASTFAPTAPPVENVYFQLDTWEGRWIAATPGAGTYTGTANPALLQGTHVVYAYATDGQDADSTGMTQQLIGRISAQVFTVVLPGTATTLSASSNPAAVGQTVTFTAGVTSSATGTPTGTVTFFDGATSLGTGTLNGSDVATFATAALTAGTNSITATYGGDGSFSASTSAMLSEIIATPNPVPTVTSLSPTAAVAGGAGFTITINGTNFFSGSVVEWNGVGLTTTFVGATQVTAVVPAIDIASSGTVAVTVFNPALGGGTSGSLTFTINNPVPGLSSLSPTSAVVGAPSFTLTLAGSNFVSGSVVKWNGAALSTTLVDGTHLTAAVPSSDLTSAGSASVTVFNPTPAGGTTSPLVFTINTPVPTVTTLAPNSAAAGSPAFTLTLTGTGFVSTSLVKWNGVALVTTIVSITQVTATVPAADISAVGSASITVFNPTPGGGTSSPQTFTINAANPVPTLGSLSANSASAGGPAFILTLTGSNFVNGTVVDWNGVALATTFVSATQLSATIPSTDIATAGIASITIFNPAPGGGTSAPQTFTIDNPVPALGLLSPTSAAAGSAGFTLVLTGSNFVNGTVVHWNGGALTTTFVDGGHLTAVVPSTDVASGGTALVTVFNPVPGGGTSSTVTFTINGMNPVPALGMITPISVTANSGAFTLTVVGSNFVNGTVVRWNGTALATTFVSNTQVTATVPAADLLNSGTISITVFNLAPGGGASGGSTFTINDPVPTLGSLSPSSVIGGGSSFTLTLNGTNFVPGTIVKWNGVALTTTFVNSTQLTALVPGADISNTDSASVATFSPAPGGGTSTTSTLTIVNFTVASSTPTETTAAGQSAVFGISTAPVGGVFPKPVTFTATGLPSGASATFTPPSVTPGTNTEMTVTTTGAAVVKLFDHRGPVSPTPFPGVLQAARAFLAFAICLTIASFAVGKRQLFRRLAAAIALFLLTVTAGYIAGCAEGFPKPASSASTPAGTYVIKVTGTSGTDVHSTTVTLVVQ